MNFDGKKLRSLRKHRDIRQLRIATMLRISTKDYQYIELDRVQPNEQLISKLCQYFEVDNNYFERAE